MYKIYSQKCDNRISPEGITNKIPVFSWRLVADAKNLEQKSYQIIVEEKDGEIVWDSEMVSSECTHDIRYNGEPLKSNMDYIWQVKSASSAGDIAIGLKQKFSTGIYEKSLWQAKWIEADYVRKPLSDSLEFFKILSGQIPKYENPEEILNPCLYFRKVITIEKDIKRASAYATAHGIYELNINEDEYGEPFVPGYTVYAKHLECQRYDVTQSLKPGKNAIGVIVADGWYTGKIGLMGIGEQYGKTNAFFMQIFVEYKDGTSEIFCSDENFKWNTGAYLYADIFIGEKYDANHELKGYRSPIFDDSDWKPVVIKEYDYSHLTGPMGISAVVLREQKPKALLKTPAGESVVDVGENIVGFVEFTLTGKKGDTVSLEYSEILDEQGNFRQNITGQNKNQKDYYVFGEDGPATYRPKFTFHGFQYVKIVGAANAGCDDFTVIIIGSDLEKTGSFTCSDDRLNRLQENIFRSQQGNMLYIPTDCPQREKAGWTGDIQVYMPTACYNMDVEGFMRKWLYDMRLEQLEDGQIPNVIPDIPSNKYIRNLKSKHICSSGWGDACVIVPYRLYETYGDLEILKENYEMMLKWMSYVENQAATSFPEGYESMPTERKIWQKYLWNTEFHFGDWLIPSLSMGGVSPAIGAMKTKELISTTMFAYSVGIMIEICSLMADSVNKKHYEELLGNIKEAFANEYVKADGILTVEYQGTYVLALQMDLIPQEKLEKAVNRLVEMIKENGNRLDTGFLSIPFLLDVLYENGRRDVAFQLLYQIKCPSWLYEVECGATTIWEAWDNINEKGEKKYSSYNHFAFGSVGDFIYRRMLGLQKLASGYKKICIKPDFGCGLSFAGGSFESIYGKVSIAWTLEDGHAKLKAQIPPGITAEVVAGNNSIKEIKSGSFEYDFKL